MRLPNWLFFKDLTGNVIAIRRKRALETRISTSDPSPPTTDSPRNASCTKSRLSEAGDIIQLVSPMVHAAAGAVPVVGPSLKSAVEGILYIIQIIDVGCLFYFIEPWYLFSSYHRQKVETRQISMT